MTCCQAHANMQRLPLLLKKYLKIFIFLSNETFSIQEMVAVAVTFLVPLPHCKTFWGTLLFFINSKDKYHNYILTNICKMSITLLKFSRQSLKL